MERYLEVTSKVLGKTVDSEDAFNKAVDESFEKVFPNGYEEGKDLVDGHLSDPSYASLKMKGQKHLKSPEQVHCSMKFPSGWLSKPELTILDKTDVSADVLKKCVSLPHLTMVLTQLGPADTDFGVDFQNVIEVDEEGKQVKDLGWFLWCLSTR